MFNFSSFSNNALDTTHLLPLLEGSITPLAVSQSTPLSLQHSAHLPLLSLPTLDVENSPPPISSLLDVENSAGAPLAPMAEMNNSTWQARNPNRPVIPSRVSKKNKISNAERASRQIAAEQRATKHEALQADINLYLKEQKRRLETIATTHDVTVKYMDCLVTSQTYYHTTRKPHLVNALIHAKAKEVNSDRAEGSRYSLSEVHELLANDLKMQPENLTEEQKEYYIQELVKQRDLMAHGVRVNNIAAGEDVFSVTHRIIDELENLHDRTGIYASLFVTHGHINDSTQASWFGTDNSAVFWEDVLGRSAGDVARLYEQWACAQGHNLEERDSLANMRKQVTALISNRLSVYISYNFKPTNALLQPIVETYGVKLLGWPTGVPFVNPSSIGTISEICKLRNSLKSGECRWKKLSKAKCNAFSSELEARHASGEVVKKPRKKRSDAGVPHKWKNVLGGNPSKEGPSSKRARCDTGRKRVVPKSTEFVRDMDNNQEDRSEEDID
ncbi:hypothetical protein PISMIDRAFT_16996 [Pisolithus microcarpus 441]|uniref:Unplaced genomic scaffold scaffold_236, whole genome shotgun sequence n=1 Tax=Pisolithus microcarpus 441 TaxID=765257 RepID=A0A0C9XRD7_9AGAM|nr:hypothetical protein BKA83DRAFT_16996 [Pisolithus microcarpus]KIK14855.1 hypothetical protein PISMIDRAFT_16996 [Pisolithus microcarpus 441]